MNERDKIAVHAKETAEPRPHRIVLDERAHLQISGVSDVDRFDESAVALSTSRGELTIRGRNLHVQHMDLDAGDLTLDGTVEALLYADDAPHPGGWRRLFR